MAEADPYLVYSGYGGLHHGYAGYGYGYSAYPYTTYHYGKREAEAESKPYFYNALHYPTLYSGAYAYGGYPYATYGIHHYGKREAEAEPKAEADPALIYSGLGYHGLGYTGVHSHYGKREAEAESKPYFYSSLHYPTVYSGAYPYATYGLHHYGKREAEAEPYYGYRSYYGSYSPYRYSGFGRTYGYGYGRYGYYGGKG